MTNLRQAAQQALEVLEELQGGCTDHDDGTVEAITVWCPETIEALRAALAEPEHESDPGAWNGWVLREVLFDNGEPIGHREPEQEPVAWMVYTLDGKSVCVTDNPADFTNEHKALPLYTAPTPRRPLTDEEIEQLLGAIADTPRAQWLRQAAIEVVRKTEAAHGIGGEQT